MKRIHNNELAFCLYRYFPHGGLQRDMLRIARACQLRGYSIHIYTTSWQDAVPEGFHVHLMRRPTAFTNHGRVRQYYAWLVQQMAKSHPRCVIGFHKMPGLDIYYTGDCCFAAKAISQHRWWYRLTPRYRQGRAFEDAVFGSHSTTHILMLSHIQESLYKQYYGTPEHRISFLPPNLEREYFTDLTLEDRVAFRQGLGIQDHDKLLLQVGSGFRTKGLDRSIRALADLPDALLKKTRFLVVGDDTRQRYVRLARRLGVASHISFLGPRDDVPHILWGADLLLHPAYNECAGNILIEALAAGLPVIVSAVCGYAHFIQKAQAGWVIPEPFQQSLFNNQVRQALARPDLDDLKRNALNYVNKENLSGKIEAAVKVIESIAQESVT